MGKYMVKVGACTDFYCPGLSSTDFANYLTLVDIPTYNAAGSVVTASNDAYVAIDDLLTTAGANSTYITNTISKNQSSLFKKTVNGTTSAFFQTLVGSQITHVSAGYVTVPYANSSGNLKIVLPGTCPHFYGSYMSPAFTYDTYNMWGGNLLDFMLSGGTCTITRTATQLKITGDETATFSKSDFRDGVIPLQLIVITQGAGGGGGNNSAFLGGSSGTGGGAGGVGFGVVNLVANSTFSVTVGKGGSAGSKGGNSFAQDGHNTLVWGNGGSGGGVGSDTQGAGGSGSFTTLSSQTYGGKQILVATSETTTSASAASGFTGASGGNTNAAGGNTAHKYLRVCSDYSNYESTSTTVPKIFGQIHIGGRSGGATDGYGGGGGASWHSAGAKAENQGWFGCGGGGASYHFTNAKNGSAGGPGYITIAY